MDKKLYRSTRDRKIAGVCGGIGEYANVDPTIIRAIFAIFAIWGGSGLLIYLALMFIMPEQPY
ncbi:MAG: PspC domain-containing protein [Erysipelotrichaceae bacterium]|nr:PspC domain-containing protein [Erysipelotrichaceae bacterium]